MYAVLVCVIVIITREKAIHVHIHYVCAENICEETNIMQKFSTPKDLQLQGIKIQRFHKV